MDKVALDELVEQQTAKVVTNKDPKMPYIGLEHIAQGEPRLLGSSTSVSSVSVNAVFNKDDILFGKLRPNLKKSIRAPFAGYCSTDILVLRSRDGVLPSFSGHVFQWDRVFAAAVATAAGTKMPRTSWSDLRLFRVSRPPTTTDQARIAYVLDTTDEAIQKTEAVIAKLKQIRAGMLHDLLTYGLDEDGKLRDPVAHPEQFKDSELGRIPKEWEPLLVSELLAGCCGHVQTGPFGSQLHANEYTESGIPVVMPQDISSTGGIDAESVARISEGRARDLSRHAMRENDVIFARRGDLSRCAAIGSCEEGWLCGTGCLLMRVPREHMLSKWFADLYRHSACQRQIMAQAVGSTMVNLNTSLIVGLRIPKVDVAEQGQILEVLRRHDDRMEKERSQLRKLHMMKYGLMDDLLSGVVAVPSGVVPEEVPA